MKRSVVIVTGILLIGCCLSFAQLKPSVAASGNPAPVQMVVTAETYRGVEIPQIAQKDVTVTQEGRNLPVTEWLPLRGENSAMELYLLIDETNDSVMNIHLEQIHEFIDRLPPATAVGVAYMRNGEANVVQTPTTDHNRASFAVHAPSSAMSADANPYASLSFLVNNWPMGPLRREILTVTSGIDVFEDTGSENVYTEMALMNAQQAGVIVHCIYTPSIGHAGHSPSLISSGQGYLAHLAEETGGEAYFTGINPPAAFAPFLADLAEHLENQYRVTFLATPRSALQRVRMTTGNRDIELVGAYGFFLKADDPRP